MKRILKGLSFFLGLILLSGSVLFLLVFYGPLTSLKTLYVTTAMTTYRHQYLATWLVREDEIAKIMNENKVAEPKENTDEKAIVIAAQLEKPETEYFDITTTKYHGYLLKVNDPKQVALAATDKLGLNGLKVEDFAKENNAIAAINAGGFADPDGRSHGGTPTGLLMTQGDILYKDNLPTYNIIGFDQHDVLVLGKYTMAKIKEMGVRDAVSFGPFLIVNGQSMITQGDGGWGIAPRTAIGQTKDGAVLLLVIDGRQLGSIGATLKDVQDIMLQYGAENAANLDGGSSSTLYYQGKVMNKPSTPAGAREVPSAFIVKVRPNPQEKIRVAWSIKKLQRINEW